jgi:glycosyltransferase involved in cell wall biosynthesis
LASNPNTILIFACRIKRPASLAIKKQIQKDLAFLGERVKFFDSVKKMPDLVGSSDVVIMPSESLFAKMDVPLVLLEAMSQKIPLVLSTSPPLGELLNTGAAIGIPPQDPQSLTRAVTEILSSQHLTNELGIKGQQAINKQFNSKLMTNSIEKLYEELLEN